MSDEEDRLALREAHVGSAEDVEVVLARLARGDGGLDAFRLALGLAMHEAQAAVTSEWLAEAAEVRSRPPGSYGVAGRAESIALAMEEQAAVPPSATWTEVASWTMAAAVAPSPNGDRACRWRKRWFSWDAPAGPTKAMLAGSQDGRPAQDRPHVPGPRRFEGRVATWTTDGGLLALAVTDGSMTRLGLAATSSRCHMADPATFWRSITPWDPDSKGGAGRIKAWGLGKVQGPRRGTVLAPASVVREWAAGVLADGPTNVREAAWSEDFFVSAVADELDRRALAFLEGRSRGHSAEAESIRRGRQRMPDGMDGLPWPGTHVVDVGTASPRQTLMTLDPRRLPPDERRQYVAADGAVVPVRSMAGDVDLVPRERIQPVERWTRPR